MIYASVLAGTNRIARVNCDSASASRPPLSRIVPRLQTSPAFSGVEPQGLGKMRRGFLEPSLADQDRSEAAMWLGQTGFEPDRLDKLSPGLLEMPLLVQATPRLLCVRAW